MSRLQEDFSILLEPSAPVDIGVLTNPLDVARVRKMQIDAPLLVYAPDISREEGTQFIRRGGDAFVDSKLQEFEFVHNVLVRGVTRKLLRSNFSRKKHILVVSENPDLFTKYRDVLTANNCWGMYAETCDELLTKSYLVPIDGVFVDAKNNKTPYLEKTIDKILTRTRLEVPTMYPTLASAMCSLQNTSPIFPFPRTFPTSMVVSGNSLAGKTSFACQLENQSSRFLLVPTYVTRLADYGEWNGDEHIFLSYEEFFDLDMDLFFHSFRKKDDFVAVPSIMSQYIRSFHPNYDSPSLTAVLSIGSMDTVRILQGYAQRVAPGSLMPFRISSQGEDVEEITRARGREGCLVKEWMNSSLGADVVELVNTFQSEKRYAPNGEVISSIYLPTPLLAFYHGCESKLLIQDMSTRCT